MPIGATIRKKLFWPRPSLIFFVTAKCHGKCLHCFAHGMKAEHELTPEQVRDFAIAFGPMGDLSISGGEPLLRKDLVELLTPLFEICKPGTCTLPTGGLYPEKTKAVVSELALVFRGKLTVSLPLEGGRELHDQIRGVPGAFDTLVKTVEQLSPLAKSGVADVKLVTTLNNLSQNAVSEIIGVAKKHFPKITFHHFELMRGQGRDPDVLPPDPEIIATSKEAIFDYWSTFKGFYGPANKVALSAKRKVFEAELGVLRGKPLPFPCRAHEMGLVLYPNGDVAYCELTPVIGNILKQSLGSILSGPSAKVAKTDIETGCSCTHSCFLPKSMISLPEQAAAAVFDTIKRR